MPFDGSTYDDGLALLIQAREQLSDPSRWCQRQLSMQKQQQHCLLGALGFHSLSLLAGSPKERAVVLINKVIGTPPREHQSFMRVANFNDRATHEEVLEVLDGAIALGTPR